MDGSTLLHSCALPDGTSRLALLAKRTYRFARGRVSLAPEQEALFTDAEHTEPERPGAGAWLLHDSDLFGIARPLTDVLVRASACSHRGPVRRLDTSVEVGRAARRIRVHGDRAIRVSAAGQLSFGEAEPFERLPITWDRAFGGRDLEAEELLARRVRPLLYPRNRAGRGYFFDVERARLDGRPAPNLEDPDDPITPERLLFTDPDAWTEHPAAAGYDAIDVYTFPRVTFLLPPLHAPPRRPLREIALGAMFEGDLTPRWPAPPNPRLYSSAPPGLAVQRLQGGERVVLRHLSPEAETVELRLPDDRPAMFVELPNIGARKLEPLLQTVRIDAERSTLALTWVGAIDVAAPFPRKMTQEMRHAAVFRDG